MEVRVRVLDLAAGLSAISCPDCDLPLNLHQPDESVPDRLLATCDTCTRWFAILELDADGTHCAMFEIPANLPIETLLSDSSQSDRGGTDAQA